MGSLGWDGDGQTPLEDEERDGLLLGYITTKSELDFAEASNIIDALFWLAPRKFSAHKLLTSSILKEIHYQMYRKVWVWAGNFRTTERNIGCSPSEIGIRLAYLLDDTQYQIKNNVYPPAEIAIRFKHRLVAIHCFPNGNGRHSRLMADLIMTKVFGLPRFTWGQNQPLEPSEVRRLYLLALRKADQGFTEPLLLFAQS